MNIAVIALVLFMQQHDPMHMPGMQMPGMQMKKPPAKKQQQKKTTKKPASQPHEQMSMPEMSMPAMSMPMPAANPNIKVIVEAPRTSAGIAALAPASTLKPDDLDAPKEPQ